MIGIHPLPGQDEGRGVIYVPGHARERGVTHPDCERGIISSVRGETVFVRYLHPRHGLQPNAKATSASDLAWDPRDPSVVRETRFDGEGATQ